MKNGVVSEFELLVGRISTDSMVSSRKSSYMAFFAPANLATSEKDKAVDEEEAVG